MVLRSEFGVNHRKLNNPQLTKYVEPLVPHGDARVRKEVLRTMRALGTAGAATTLSPFSTIVRNPIELFEMKIMTSGGTRLHFQYGGL